MRNTAIGSTDEEVGLEEVQHFPRDVKFVVGVSNFEESFSRNAYSTFTYPLAAMSTLGEGRRITSALRNGPLVLSELDTDI